LSNAARGADAKSRNAAILDMPHRIGERREARRDGVVLVAYGALHRCDVGDGVDLDLLLFDAIGARGFFGYRVLGGTRGKFMTDTRKTDAHARRHAACAAGIAP